MEEHIIQKLEHIYGEIHIDGVSERVSWVEQKRDTLGKRDTIRAVSNKAQLTHLN